MLYQLSYARRASRIYQTTALHSRWFTSEISTSARFLLFRSTSVRFTDRDEDFWCISRYRHHNLRLYKTNDRHISLPARNARENVFSIELFHDQLPLAMPCYDLTLVTELTLGPHRGETSGIPSFPGLTGGFHFLECCESPRSERIFRTTRAHLLFVGSFVLSVF